MMMNGNCLKERRELKVNTLFKRRVKRLFILHSQELDWTCNHGARNKKFFYRLSERPAGNNGTDCFVCSAILGRESIRMADY